MNKIFSVATTWQKVSTNNLTQSLTLCYANSKDEALGWTINNLGNGDYVGYSLCGPGLVIDVSEWIESENNKNVD